jgi:amidase
MGELWRNSATALAGMIARKEVTSAEVVEDHLARIEAVNPIVNALPIVLADSARAAAAEADRAIAGGAPLAPFHGVPMTVKLNMDLVGSPTTNGVPAMAGAMPTMDHPAVERLKAAGAIPIARSNLPDMGLRVHTDSALHGLTRNPWDLEKTAGGSSGGEAAALATGMTPLGLGNDIGGSLRNPAFCCGISSLKPSLGRIPSASSIEPQDGLLVGQLMAVHGPMARTVADLRAALGVVAGRHVRDPWSSPADVRGPIPGTPIRVAVVPDPPGGTTAPAISAGVQRAAEALADAGYDVREVTPPMVEECITTWGRWISWEFGTIREVMASIMSPVAAKFFFDFADSFGPATVADHAHLLAVRHGIARAWSAFMAEYPLILGPTWCQPQFPHGADVAEGGIPATLNLMRFVTPMNLLGLPVVCVPVGTNAGLPLGVQVAGDRLREDLCLEAAEAIEARLGVITPIDPVL